MSSTTMLRSADRSSLLPRIGWIILLLGALMAAGNAFLFVLVEGFGNPVAKQRMLETAAIGYVHILGGAFATLIGPFQFLGSLRRSRQRIHAWLGRVYLLCVVSGAIAGFYLSFNTDGYAIGDVGFLCLASAWLVTACLAYTSIRKREVKAHREWMIRSYALTYAAVMLRIELPILWLGLDLSLPMSLTITGWLCWIPNLLVVEWWIRRTRANDRSNWRASLPGQPSA